MNLYELNKWAGAILGSALLIIVINEVGNVLVHPEQMEKSVLNIEVAAADTASEAKDEAKEEGPGLAVLLAEADADKGAKVAKKCNSCHTFEEGGANKIGPNLWNIPGGAKAGKAGFSYSGALTDLGGEWSYADLDAFLASPKSFAKGTKMAFAGIKKPTDRADLIAYMRQMAANPPALPTE